jgi:hypothetical protein
MDPIMSSGGRGLGLLVFCRLCFWLIGREASHLVLVQGASLHHLALFACERLEYAT